MSKLRKEEKEKAAQLLADGRLSDQKIADELGISRMTLWNWRKNPSFDARVKELLQEFAERASKYGIARREARIAVQQELQAKLLTVIDERAKDAQDNGSTIPGMKTGLVCKTIKGIGKGEDFQVVEVYEVDTPAVKAVIALHEQAAKEMGQFVESEQRAKSGLAEAIADARKRAGQAKKYASEKALDIKPPADSRVN